MQHVRPTEKDLPPFQIAASVSGAFSTAEMDALIRTHRDRLDESRLGTGQGDQKIRRSHVAFLKRDGEDSWVYDRIWQAATELNRHFFCVGIDSVADNIQLARYDSSNHGYYDWHTDFADLAPNRKISITVQLSDPDDYDGGDLELLFSGRAAPADRTRGMMTAFPSFVLHRVTPVTRGTRWSLVAWVSGPRWR